MAGSALLVRAARPSATDPDVLAHLALTQVALANSAAVPGHSTDDLLDLAERLAGPGGNGNRTQRLRILATATTAHCVHGLPDDLRERLRHAIDAAAGDDGGLLALVGRVLLHPSEHAAQARDEMPGLLRVIRERYLSDEAERWPSRPQIIIGAREQLGAALRAFEDAGASPWAERAAAELRAAGVAPAPPATARDAGRRAVPGAAAVLTAQELQIARMAAAGLTNREIADRIYLSHRTVATHLYKVFPKLGVSNRTQLRAALEQADAL